MAISVNVGTRRGYDGPIRGPAFLICRRGGIAEGGYIAAETLDATGVRSVNRRGVITVTAGEGRHESPHTELTVTGEATLADGSVLRRSASGMGVAVDVAGGTGLPDMGRQATSAKAIHRALARHDNAGSVVPGTRGNDRTSVDWGVLRWSRATRTTSSGRLQPGIKGLRCLAMSMWIRPA